MSAPPLPETFGNYALDDFIEVVSPAAVSWLPQTSGWWWLSAALLLTLLNYGWKRLRAWYRDRYRREAVQRLQQLLPAAGEPELVSQVNKLLKLTAITAYSREQVASLSGQEWVDFLQRQTTEPLFSPEQGQTLATGAYRVKTLEAGNGRALIAASLAWVQGHQATQHG
jgi:hypothetical protein